MKNKLLFNEFQWIKPPNNEFRIYDVINKYLLRVHFQLLKLRIICCENWGKQNSLFGRLIPWARYLIILIKMSLPLDSWNTKLLKTKGLNTNFLYQQFNFVIQYPKKLFRKKTCINRVVQILIYDNKKNVFSYLSLVI